MKKFSKLISTNDMRRNNRYHVLSAIRKKEPVSRSGIAALTGLTEPAVSRITRELIEVGLLEETSQPFCSSKAGRPSIGLRLKHSGAFIVCFEIAAIAQSLSLVNMRGDVLKKRNIDLLSFKNPIQALGFAAANAKQLVEDSGIDRTRLLGAGVSIAGVVDSSNSTLVNAPNLGWKNVPVSEEIARQLRIPVRVESRPGALLLAEYRLGIARGKEDVVLILPALGIGGAVMMSGSLVRGFNNAAGQIGHLPVTKGRGVCSCGRKDCLDTVASGHAILTRLGVIPKRVKQTGHGANDAKLLQEVIKSASDGNLRAVRGFHSAGEQLGLALKRVAVILDPEIIILAGIASQTQSYKEGILKGFSNFNEIPIVVSKISNETASSWLALEAFVFSRDLDFNRLRSDVSF